MGEVSQGSVTADNKTQAHRELSGRGFFVKKISADLGFKISNKNVSNKELLRLIKSMRSLMNSGIPLTDTLKIISDEPETKKLGVYVEGIYQEIIKGSSFSDACRNYDDIFDEVFVSSVKVGEKTGDLALSLENYQEYLLQKIYLNKKIKSALTYPIFLMSALSIVVGILFVYVIPNFADLFSSFDAALPAPTQLVISLASYSHYIAAFLVSFIIISILVIKSFGDKPEIKLMFDSLLLKVPIFGSMRDRAQKARLTGSFSSLLTSGVTVAEAIYILSESFKGTRLGESLALCSKSVVEGESMFNSFKRFSVFDGYALKMLSIGEKSSQLETVLNDIASYQQEELDEKIDRFTSLLEPFLIMFMGLLMGFVIIAMYLPIFFISDVVQ